MIWPWIFWISFALVFYVYAGYPFFLFLWIHLRPAPEQFTEETPEVTVLIAAYNESDCIAETLHSILTSDYPAQQLTVCVVSDHSTDDTEALVKNADPARVRLIRTPRRLGKTNALRHALPLVNSELVLLADASGVFNPDTVSLLVRRMATPDVGACVGRKRILRGSSTVGPGDGAYWGYETWLRWAESRTGSSLIGCEGGVTLIRRAVLTLDFSDALAEDTALGYVIYQKKQRCLLEPRAIVREAASDGFREEFMRKRRVIVRGMQAAWAFRTLFNPFCHPRFCFQNISHRLARWMVPFPLALFLVASFFAGGELYRALFFGQCAFYTLAAAGIRWGHAWRFRLLNIPAYFVAVNGAALLAWFSAGHSWSVWQRTQRDAKI